MINIVLSIYEIWPTLSYPFFRIWSTLSYLFIKYDQPCLIYLWVWGLICHLAFTESAPENLSTTKTVSNNYFVNKYEFFKSTPMIFLSTSTANENSHQHQLQPITMYIRVSHLHFFWIFILFQAGMNARHTKEQKNIGLLCFTFITSS